MLGTVQELEKLRQIICGPALKSLADGVRVEATRIYERILRFPSRFQQVFL